MIYAIPDIHGHLAKLDRALRLIEADGGPDAEVVFLGDYVDRGPDSASVLQRLMDGQAQGRRWTCLKGNHDRLLQNFVIDGVAHDDRIRSGRTWLDPKLGGLTTLQSYGVDVDAPDLLTQARDLVPQTHIDFLQNLPLWHAHDDLIFVHAGIRPGLPMGYQQENDLIWIREPFLTDTRDHGALIVHGHTALDRPQHFGNRVDLDGGAGHGRMLIPAVFEGRDCHILNDRGRWPLRP